MSSGDWGDYKAQQPAVPEGTINPTTGLPFTGQTNMQDLMKALMSTGQSQGMGGLLQTVLSMYAKSGMLGGA